MHSLIIATFVIILINFKHILVDLFLYSFNLSSLLKLYYNNLQKNTYNNNSMDILKNIATLITEQ